MKTYVFDHYYTYPELTQTLQQLMQEYPGLIQVESICTTPDQHEVWAATITNFATGDPLKKPAYYADGNHHAGEVTGSMAALGLIVKLVQGYGNQENITTLLDHSTVYVIPRISPDGAELILTTPEQFRSVNRPYPYDEMTPGLHPKDMDGDGVIRMMRVRDANGVWKPMDKDPRILVKRSPSDFGGTYYNKFKKITIRAKSIKDGQFGSLSPKCKVYVRSSKVKNQLRKFGFEGTVIVKKNLK